MYLFTRGLYNRSHKLPKLQIDGVRRTTDDERRTTTTTTTDDDDDDDEQISKNTFKPCHHIEFNTTNPNPIFKSTISFIQTPEMPNYFRKLGNFWMFWKIQKSKNYKKSNVYFVLCISSIIRIFYLLWKLYFCTFYNVCNFLHFYIIN